MRRSRRQRRESDGSERPPPFPFDGLMRPTGNVWGAAIPRFATRVLKFLVNITICCSHFSFISFLPLLLIDKYAQKHK